MIGIKFELPIEYNNFLTLILEPVDLELYTWYITQDEIIYFDKSSQKVRADLLKDRVYSGNKFRNTIENVEYLIYLVNIQAYPIGESNTQIQTYSDFMESNCKLIFLCADCKYVDIYCKDIEILKKIYRVCIANNFSNIELITQDNNTRTKFSL